MIIKRIPRNLFEGLQKGSITGGFPYWICRPLRKSGNLPLRSSPGGHASPARPESPSVPVLPDLLDRAKEQAAKRPLALSSP